MVTNDINTSAFKLLRYFKVRLKILGRLFFKSEKYWTFIPHHSILKTFIFFRYLHLHFFKWSQLIIKKSNFQNLKKKCWFFLNLKILAKKSNLNQNHILNLLPFIFLHLFVCSSLFPSGYMPVSLSIYLCPLFCSLLIFCLSICLSACLTISPPIVYVNHMVKL